MFVINYNYFVRCYIISSLLIIFFIFLKKRREKRKEQTMHHDFLKNKCSKKLH